MSSSHIPEQSQPITDARQHEQKEKFVTRTSLLVDAVLVGAFFVFMFFVVRSHVQSENPVFITLWGGGAAACLSAVFWLAIQMFRVVLRAQCLQRRAK